MATAKLLKQLIKAGSEGNQAAFRQASEQLIQEERDKNHHVLADDLEKIIHNRKQVVREPLLSNLLPKDKERNLPLLQIKNITHRMEDIVLSDENASLLSELLREHHSIEKLHRYGLYPANRILFCGPPGCGKSLTAEVLACELGLPLAIVRIDSVVSSLLGETASNLRQVFDFISLNPMVVLFDEFDALAKERADSAEHGELKRVVNAFLQMLDAYEGKSILVAATNHENILDAAIWRRFDEVLVFENPNLEQLRRLLNIKLRSIRREFNIDDPRITSLFKGMSHADVERVLYRAIKDMVLSQKEVLSERQLQAAVQREEARKARMQRD